MQARTVVTAGTMMVRSASEGKIMPSKDFIFWEVDVQRDFMLPGGNLYVPGAEKLVPPICNHGVPAPKS